MSKNKHLTDADRLQIEILLKQRCPLKKIAAQLGKSTSTISREVQKRASESDKFARIIPTIAAPNAGNANVSKSARTSPTASDGAPFAAVATKLCPAYEEDVCYKLYESPYVCNGCPDESRCVLRKRYYLHKQVHDAYCEMLRESRIGANITEDELIDLNGTLSDLIKRGQSVHHIFANNPE